MQEFTYLTPLAVTILISTIAHYDHITMSGWLPTVVTFVCYIPTVIHTRTCNHVIVLHVDHTLMSIFPCTCAISQSHLGALHKRKCCCIIFALIVELLYIQYNELLCCDGLLGSPGYHYIVQSL